MSMKSFVGLTVAFAQSLYLFHILVVFFRSGKEFKQPRFEQVVRLRGLRKKLSSPWA
jgi:uncharacterized membrane protein